MINEEWRDIQGYEGVYQVNPIGQVKRIGGGSGAVRGLVLKDFDNGHGYRYISLSKDGKGRNYYIHVLLATAFIPNPERKPQINHRNGQKSDNRLENLEWVTLSEQMIHAYGTGLAPSGEYNHMAKLTEYEVGVIRRLHMAGVARPVIASSFGISKATVHRIVHRELWRNVA